MTQYIAQALSLIAAGVIISSYQCKSTKKLIFIQIISGVMFLVTFFLLKEPMGLVMNIAGIVRCVLLSTEKEWARSKTSLIILLVGMVIGGCVWGGISTWYSFFPLVATFVGTILMWSENGKIIRIGQLIAVSPFWLAYNIIVFSLGGIIAEAFAIISIGVSFLRFGMNGFENKVSLPKKI